MMKLKILFVLIPMCILGGAAKNQVPPDAPKENILQELKNDSRELKEATEDLKKVTPPQEPKPRIIYKVKKVYVIKEVPPEDHKVLLTIGGNQYEVDPVFYKGYDLIDVDSIQNAIVEAEIEDAMYRNDSLSQVMLEEANDHINLWQKVKLFFKRKN